MATEEWCEVAVEKLKAPQDNALATGPFGSSISSRYFQEHGVPIIRGSNLSEDVGTRLNDEGLVFLSEEKAAEFKRSVVRKGDLIFTCWGTINQVGLIDKRARYAEYVISNKQMKLTPDRRKADSLFLYYLFSCPEMQDVIKNQGIGSSVPGFNLGQLRSMRLEMPPLSEQRAIARILGTLDDKIELNRRMNETLEAMARALFRSWFVDFDPVRAKAEGRDAGLPKPVADLFPARLVDSELGEIPEGWRYSALGELVSLTRGRTYKSSLKGLPGPVLLGLASLERNGGFRDDKLSTYGGDSPVDLVLGPGDLFASLKDVTQSADLLGAVARVPAHVEHGRLTQDTVKLNFRSARASRHIVYCTLLTLEYRDYCRSHATGTTNLGLSRDDFLAYPIVEPSEDIQREFDTVIGSIEARAAGAAAESRTLAALRDALLPKLISGELRVRDAQRFVGGVDSVDEVDSGGA